MYPPKGTLFHGDTAQKFADFANNAEYALDGVKDMLGPAVAIGSAIFGAGVGIYKGIQAKKQTEILERIQIKLDEVLDEGNDESPAEESTEIV